MAISSIFFNPTFTFTLGLNSGTGHHGCLIPNGTHMNSHDEQFFKSLGSRISSARKAQNLTQQQVAEQLGIAQQTYAHYEVGRVRFPASTLPVLAHVLGLTTEELLGQTAKSRAKPGPTPKLQQLLERLHQLPKTKQRIVMGMLNALLARAGL